MGLENEGRMTRRAYTWDEPAFDVVARASARLSPDRGWRRSGSLRNPEEGVTFKRTRRAPFVLFHNGHWFFNLNNIEFEDTVVVWPAYARVATDTPEAPSYVEQPWTTVLIQESDLKLQSGWNCYGPPDPRRGLGLSFAPAQNQPLE